MERRLSDVKSYGVGAHMLDVPEILMSQLQNLNK